MELQGSRATANCKSPWWRYCPRTVWSKEDLKCLTWDQWLQGSGCNRLRNHPAAQSLRWLQIGDDRQIQSVGPNLSRLGQKCWTARQGLGLVQKEKPRKGPRTGPNLGRPPSRN